MFKIKGNEKASTLRVSQLREGDLYLASGSLRKDGETFDQEDVCMAVGYYNDSDQDVRYIKPFAQVAPALADTTELDYHHADMEIIRIEAIVSDINIVT